MITVKDVRDALHPDVVSKRNGVFTIRKGFFYTGGFTSEKYAEKVLRNFAGVEILGHGEVWKAFRGGASVSDSSHWWVKFRSKE